MKNIWTKITQRKAAPHRRKNHSKAQSLVEVAIAFPLLIMIFSGLVEFGFMLNYYLSVVDATRESARFFSNLDPYNSDFTDNMDFYQGAAEMVITNLEPKTTEDTSRRISLDSSSDDVIVSVFSVTSNGYGTNVLRFPTSTGGEYHWFNNEPSKFTTADIQNRLVGTAPNSGILLVEVYYHYHQILALPWITVFVPDPVTIYAYTIMPLSAAEPTPTPVP